MRSTFFHSQKWPGLDNTLYVHVSERPFPKKICFVVFSQAGVSKGA